jgi:hypothetical protein
MALVIERVCIVVVCLVVVVVYVLSSGFVSILFCHKIELFFDMFCGYTIQWFQIQ